MKWVLWKCLGIDGIVLRLNCIIDSYCYLYLLLVDCWCMDELRIMALENGKLTYFHAILKLFLFGLIHLWWRCVLIECVLIMALKALYECYCIVILLYMNEAICKVLYEAICEGMMWMSFTWSYMWRYDVNKFYVKLYVKEWCE